MKVIALHGFTCPGNDLPLTFHSTRSYCLFREIIMNKTSTGPKMFQLGCSAEVISQTEATHISIHIFIDTLRKPSFYDDSERYIFIASKSTG